MKVEVYWRMDRIKTGHSVWTFWSDGYVFSCSCLSIHKKRRPVRIFLGFSHYRPLNKYGYKGMGKFMVEERERHNLTIKP